MAALSAWALTTGEAGMRSQARGLALAVAGQVTERTVRLRWPWSWLRAGAPGVLGAIEATDGAPLGPPWPDLIVTCGRRAGMAGVALKTAAGGGPLLVHVQDPLADPGLFDLIVAMEHDDIAGPKVLKVLTALHHLTTDRLAAAGAEWRPRLAHLPRPLTGVLLGGPAKHGPFGVPEASLLRDRLLAHCRATGGGAAIVPSRRTPDAALAVFAEAARADPVLWVWDRSGDNPYAGLLATADRLVVTGDSVSMISEALATPHPVEIFTATVRRRHEGFLQTLVDRGYARLFDGTLAEPRARPRLDATEDAARAVRKLLATRGR